MDNGRINTIVILVGLILIILFLLCNAVSYIPKKNKAEYPADQHDTHKYYDPVNK